MASRSAQTMSHVQTSYGVLLLTSLAGWKSCCTTAVSLYGMMIHCIAHQLRGNEGGFPFPCANGIGNDTAWGIYKESYFPLVNSSSQTSRDFESAPETMKLLILPFAVLTALALAEDLAPLINRRITVRGKTHTIFDIPDNSRSCCMRSLPSLNPLETREQESNLTLQQEIPCLQIELEKQQRINGGLS